MGKNVEKRVQKRYVLLIVVCVALTLSFFFLLSGIARSARLDAPKQSIIASSTFSRSSDSLSLRADANARARLEFVYRGKVYAYDDKIIEPTDHTVSETIHSRKINASLDEKMQLVDKCISAGASYKEAMLYCFPLLDSHITKIKKDVDLAPTNSQITFKPNSYPMFNITKDKEGYELIEENVYRDAYFSLKRNMLSVVSVIPKTLTPSEKVKDNIKLTSKRASFSTSFSTSGQNRSHNIALALEKINGTVLEPNEEFSFNKTVGRRSEKEGFLPAPIILQGEYTDGFGGGVCQASTTLYNAAIRADVLITSVRNHSYPASYVDPSFDAMVNSGTSDLKFKNSSGGKIFIRAIVKDKTAIIEFYGLKLPYTIVTESVTVLKKDPPVDKEIIDNEFKYIEKGTPAGTKMRATFGKGELKSEGYLLFYDNKSGKLIERRLIRKDTYKSSQGIIAIAPEEEQA